MKKIQVWIKRTGEDPRHVWISNTLQNLQNHVGGYIECITLAANVVIICNEEGRLMGLPYNCEIGGIGFVGTIIFAGVEADRFVDCPLDTKGMKTLFPDLWDQAGVAAPEESTKGDNIDE